MPFECVLVDAYKGTRRKHDIKFRQIGHTTSQYGQSFFPKTIPQDKLMVRHSTVFFFLKEDLFHKSTKKINGNIYNKQSKKTSGIKQ